MSTDTVAAPGAPTSPATPADTAPSGTPSVAGAHPEDAAAETLLADAVAAPTPENVRVSGRQNTPKPADAPPTPAPPPADPKAAKDTKPSDWKVDDLPDGARKLIADLRKEAGEHRVAAKTASDKVTEVEGRLTGFLDGFAKVMGLTQDTDPEPPDPAKLTAELEGTQRSHREALAKLAVYEAAGAHGANPAALTDSVSFLGRINKLDPAADDYAAQVSAVVAETVASNPVFKLAGQAPAPSPQVPSGGEFTGGPGGPRDPESLSVDDFRKQLARRS